MSFQLRLLHAAQADLDHIFCWLADRSLSGAARWYDAFFRQCEAVIEDPLRFPLASENESVERDIREFTFRTRRGRRYRALFTIVEDEIRILCVRGPGQPPVDVSNYT